MTTLSWNQDLEEISGQNIQIQDASLLFDYKINELWPSSSPNSEFRIFINTNQHAETIKLSKAKTYIQKCKEGGFDITSLVPKDKEITLIVQVYLADEFGLDREIIISIDNIYLNIETVQIVDWTSAVIGLSIGMIALVSIFTLYQTHFKYPPVVRKARKLRKKIKKKRKVKSPIIVNDRGAILNKTYQDKIKILELEPEQPELVDKLEILNGNKQMEDLEKEGR